MKKISTIIFMCSWMLIPALVAYTCRNSSASSVDVFLKFNFYYPSSINNITTYWLRDAPFYRVIYIICWYINSLIFNAWYAFYLVKNNKLIYDNIKDKSNGKLFLIISGYAFFGLFFYSNLFFDKSKNLPDKLYYLLNNDFGFYILMPLLIFCATLFLLTSCIYGFYFCKRFIKG